MKDITEESTQDTKAGDDVIVGSKYDRAFDELHWQSYCTFQREPEVPWTINRTEQVSGRMKMRARTVRGYKTWPGMQTGLMLAGMQAF